MNTQPTPRPASLSNAPLRVVLAAGELLRLAANRPVTVTCLQGTCWLTREGDALDHLLGAGMAHQVATRGLTIVQALTDCVVELPVGAVQWSRRATAA